MLEELADASPAKETAVAIGVFDGVHLGHQALVRRTRQEAEARGLASAVVTFRNHPRTVLSPDFEPRYLMDLDHRLEVLRSMGIDLVVAINFTREVSQLRAREFAQRLKDGLRMKLLVSGPDFALGKNREGDLATLSQLGKEIGYKVVCEDFVQEDNFTVSSTAIREALGRGDVGQVHKLMARPFSLVGPVVVGDKRGHLLGFPTANIEVAGDRAMPADGIYATKAVVHGEALDSIAYIGIKPTFDGVKRATEVFIFDFEGDLYGQNLPVEFIAQIRGDMRFSSSNELIDQMNLDVARAREVLADSYVNG